MANTQTLQYSATKSNFLKISSIIFIVIILWAAYQTYLRQIYLVTLICVLVLAYGFIFNVISYAVDDKFCYIKYWMHEKKISLGRVSSVSILKDFSYGIRIFANGGLFSYCGLFYNTEIGRYWGYLNHKKSPILIKLKDGKKIVISPDDSQKMHDLLITRL